MRIAIIQFPGTTCSRETSLAVARAGMTPVLFLWNDDLTALAHCAGYILAGGFSYEDRARAGVIAALHPIIAVLKEQSELGKPVLGICNGAQILVESGMVPGLQNYSTAMALSDNKRISKGTLLGTGFYNAWTHLRNQGTPGAFTHLLKEGQVLRLPIAHGEGRFQLDDALWDELKQQQVNTLHYCDEQGNSDETFPTNPNGSAYNLAAISNASGTIMAMMPHPERANDGDIIFQSMKEFIERKAPRTTSYLNYQNPLYLPSMYQRPQQAKEVLITPLTSDNHALTVEKVLRQKGLKAAFKRYIHWEINCSPEAFTQLVSSDALYNRNKEQRVNETSLANEHTLYFLVRSKEDLSGQQKKHYVEQHLGIKNIEQLKQSILWEIRCTEQKHEEVLEYLTRYPVLFNPYAQECSYYRPI